MRRRIASRRDRAWNALVQSPHLPIALYLGLLGFVAILGGGFVPDSLELTLPTWLVQTWTFGIAFGGVAGSVGLLAEHNRLEALGMVMMTYGASLYGVVVVVVAWPIGLATFTTCFAVASMCLIRLHILALARKAHRRAIELEEQGP